MSCKRLPFPSLGTSPDAAEAEVMGRRFVPHPHGWWMSEPRSSYRFGMQAHGGAPPLSYTGAKGEGIQGW